MNEQQNAGRPSGKERGGFEFGSGKDRDRKDNRKRNDAGGGSGAFRIVTELSALEKALTKNDYSSQKASLDTVLKTLRPMRLKSLDGLDANAKGRLLTSLLRVVRQPKPKAAEVSTEQAAAAVETPVEVAAESTEVAAAETAAPAAEVVSETAPVSEPAAAVEVAVVAAAPVAKTVGLDDVLFTVGLIWKSVNDESRAGAAFAASGRQPTEADLTMPAVVERPALPVAARGPKGAGKGAARGRPARPERSERSERSNERFEKPIPFESTGDLTKDAQALEKLGRTRDAGRLYEKQSLFADAARAYETGGDLKAALRNVALGKLNEPAKVLMAKLPKLEVIRTLEKINAWELLMGFYVQHEAYESVAQLYERANQFDQAGLAYEKAQKLTLARRAYERAKDFAAANRVRDVEVKRLVEKGDRLGAATLLMAVGRRAETVELMNALPPAKAYGFLKKLKLEDDAKSLAETHLQEAIASKNDLQRARWLEITGKMSEALDIYLSSGRKDKASFVLESLGQSDRAAQLAEEAGQLVRAEKLFRKANDTVNAERVSKLPRPEEKAPETETAAEESAEPSTSAEAS